MLRNCEDLLAVMALADASRPETSIAKRSYKEVADCQKQKSVWSENNFREMKQRKRNRHTSGPNPEHAPEGGIPIQSSGEQTPPGHQ
jgi:hypothetical protein